MARGTAQRDNWQHTRALTENAYTLSAASDQQRGLTAVLSGVKRNRVRRRDSENQISMRE